MLKSYTRLRALMLALTASIMMWGHAHFAAAQNAISDVPHLPNLTSYNCARVTTDTTASTRHVGQVIKGRYYEWHEVYILADTQQRLACISLVRPSTTQLSADQAKTFLTDSLAIGAPAASATDRATTQATPDTAASVEPANVKPEPIKRVRQPAASSSGAETKSSISDIPPLAASKNFDDQAAVPSAAPSITLERSAAATDTARAQTIGVDDRQQIASTLVYPWNTLAYLSVTYPNGDSFRCSATLVSPYVALTAGHCVHNRNRGGYIASARVYPGQNDATLGDNNPIRPYGVKSDISSAQTTSQWVQISGDDSYVITDYRYDLAALEFKTAFTHTSTFMPVLYSNTGNPITSAGYPASVQNSGATAFGLYAETGNETNQSFNSLRQQHVREFSVDATGGNSGGPFIYVDPNTAQRYVVGSLSYSEDLDDQSGGPWYDSWNQGLVSGWVSWTPGAATAGTVTGLRVASVFSSALTTVTSYLRFYNAGTTAGTVDVTLADYATGAVLGTWTSPSIAGHRTRQYAVADIEADASATFTKPTMYSISVRPTFTGQFQNTVWNKNSATLSNASTCDTESTDQKTLMYVHSSLLGTYSSTVVIHNTGTASVSPTFGIYNAETGARITGYNAGAIPANAQKVVAVSDLEKAAGITPSTAYHYNIVAETTFTGYLQQFLNNQAASILVDMTASCTLAP